MLAHAELTLPSCGRSSMGEALLLEAVCISSSDMTGAVSLEPADKLPPFSPLSSPYLAADVSKTALLVTSPLTNQTAKGTEPVSFQVECNSVFVSFSFEMQFLPSCPGVA